MHRAGYLADGRRMEAVAKLGRARFGRPIQAKKSAQRIASACGTFFEVQVFGGSATASMRRPCGLRRRACTVTKSPCAVAASTTAPPPRHMPHQCIPRLSQHGNAPHHRTHCPITVRPQCVVGATHGGCRNTRPSAVCEADSRENILTENRFRRWHMVRGARFRGSATASATYPYDNAAPPQNRTRSPGDVRLKPALPPEPSRCAGIARRVRGRTRRYSPAVPVALACRCASPHPGWNRRPARLACFLCAAPRGCAERLGHFRLPVLPAQPPAAVPSSGPGARSLTMPAEATSSYASLWSGFTLLWVPCGFPPS